MGIQWKKRVTAAEIAFKTGKVPTLDEINEAEDRERHAAAEHTLDRLVREAPLQCVFPGDVLESRPRDSWKSLIHFSEWKNS